MCLLTQLTHWCHCQNHVLIAPDFQIFSSLQGAVCGLSAIHSMQNMLLVYFSHILFAMRYLNKHKWHRKHSESVLRCSGAVVCNVSKPPAHIWPSFKKNILTTLENKFDLCGRLSVSSPSVCKSAEPRSEDWMEKNHFLQGLSVNSSPRCTKFISVTVSVQCSCFGQNPFDKISVEAYLSKVRAVS